MNKVILVGNLAKDPELVTTNSGVSMCKFTIAVQRRFASADGNRETDFIPVVVWRGQAENVHKFLKKGSKAAVIGTMQTRNYEAQDGGKRYITEVVADEVEFLSSKSASDDSVSTPRPTKSKESKATVEEFEPIDDDDLPF